MSVKVLPRAEAVRTANSPGAGVVAEGAIPPDGISGRVEKPGNLAAGSTGFDGGSGEEQEKW